MKPLFTSRNSRILWILAALLAGVIFVSRPGRAQLQQSGGPGSTVTVTSITGALPAGSNAIGSVTATQSSGANLHVDVDSAPTTAVTGTFWQTTQPVSIASLPALAAGTNLIGTAYTIPKTACGNTVESQALEAVPTSSTAVFTSTVCLMVIVLNNTNSSSVTVTVSDDEGTPVNDVLTFSIPANSQLIQPLWGVAFTSGVKWAASASGVTGAVLGYT